MAILFTPQKKFQALGLRDLHDAILLTGPGGVPCYVCGRVALRSWRAFRFFGAGTVELSPNPSLQLGIGEEKRAKHSDPPNSKA